MRLIRHGERGRERPGLVAPDGSLRDLGGVVADLAGPALGCEALDRLRRIDPLALPELDPATRLGVPVAGTSKIVCIGLNYADHAAELGLPLPVEPTLFLKPTTALAGARDPLVVPPGSQKLDFEVELAVVIGTPTRRVPAERVHAHLAGYCIANDVTERSWNERQGGQWTRGKGGDGFAPLGPWLVTPEEVPDPQNLAVWLEVDGRRMQDGSTRTMIFDVATIVSFVSHTMTLLPGDVVLTGTPPGVGHGRKPPFYLRPGMTVRAGISGLGEMSLPVVAATDETGP